MKIINRLSGEVVGLNRNKSAAYTITVKNWSLYLSKSLKAAFGFKIGQFVSFINDGRDWRFYVDEDPDGFVLHKNGRGNGGLEISNSGLVHMIRKSTGRQEEGNVVFPVMPTVLEHHGKKIFLIQIEKAIIQQKPSDNAKESES